MVNPTTPKLDPTTLTPSQLDGVACVKCFAEDDAMVPAGIVNGVQVFACIPCEDKREDKQLPAAWEKAAQEAASKAAEAVRIEYQSAMQAIKAERDSDAPAYWLQSFPCPEWCTDTDAHRSSDDPADRQHDSDVHAVAFETMRPSTSYATYQAPDLALGLTQGYREAEARVWMEMDGEPVGHASLDEAEQLAFHLLDLVRRARGLEPVQVLPFDSQGRCDDTACISCRRDTGKASA